MSHCWKGYSRTQHMLVSTRGMRWKQVQLVMFTVYVDDSGSSKDQKVAIASALIIPAAKIAHLDSQWAAAKVKHGFSDFHTSEFVARNPYSDFAGWNDSKHRKVFERVRQITKNHGARAISVAVNKSDYEEVMSKDFRLSVGGNHYTWAVHHLMSHLWDWKIKQKQSPPFEFVFDWMESGSWERMEIETTMARIECAVQEWGKAGEFSNYSFRHRKDVPGLESADLIAWTSFQTARLAFYDVPVSDFGSIAGRYFEGILGADGWLKAVTVRRPHLERWVQQVHQPGGLDTFQRIEAKRLAMGK
jgi:hypothetical protein